MYVKFIDKMGDDLTAANAARVSFNRESESLSAKDIKLIDYLARNQHLSPFEHLILTVEMKVPLYISKQIMRHRTFSYNEVSRRYTAEEIEFYTPKEWRKQSTDNKQCSAGSHPDSRGLSEHVESFYQGAEAAYNYLLSQGVAREMARGVLPQNLYTKFWQTGNLRNWVHFCKLRLDPHAQYEVRYVAEQVKAILLERFPNSTKALFNDN